MDVAMPVGEVMTLKKIFSCNICQKTFSSLSNLNLHVKIHSDEKLYACDICWKTFGRKSSLQRHQKTHSQVFSMQNNTSLDVDITPEEPIKTLTVEKKRPVCLTCGKDFLSTSNLNQHKKIHLNIKPFICDICQKSFLRKTDLFRHSKIHNERPTFKCDKCDRVFTRKDNLMQHMRLHESSRFTCPECDKVFNRKFNLRHHLHSQHSRTPLVSVKRKKISSNVRSKKSKQFQSNALNVFQTMMLYPDEREESDLEVFFSHLRVELQERLTSEIHEKGAIKWYFVVKISLERITDNGELEEIQSYFRCQCFTELIEDTIHQHLEEGFSKINKSFEEFLQRGSGWKLRKIHYLELKIGKFHPLAASSFISLPKKLTDKKAVLNIKNEDNKCLVWCLLAFKLNLHFSKNPERLSHYQPFENDIKLGNIECPIPLMKIPIIEQLNNLRINVFGYEEDEVCPLYISPKEDSDVINLLLVSDGEKQHYCLIRSFSRLLGDLTNHKAAVYYCYRCLHRFSREDLLKDHSEYCRQHAAQHIKMPNTNDNILKFTGIHLQHPVAYTIYADFESLLIPIASATPSSKLSFIEKTTYHFPCGYAYVIIGPDGRCVKKAQVYRGKDCVEHFLNRMIREKDILGRKLLNIKPMKLSPEEEKVFQEAMFCSICKQPLDEKRTRDHDHLSGAFRGAAHMGCNLNFKQCKTIPVIFHNLKNYDGHHLMRKLGKFKDYTIEVIATTLEKYISFKLRKPLCPIQMVFLDSFQFLPASLEMLVRNLEPDQFTILEENFPKNSNLHMLTRKGVYPYDYFTSFEKFNEKELPPPAAFYNSLTNEDIQDDDYQHALNVWKTFNIQSLGEYHDLYVKTDVLLLADVFQNFRKLCQLYYNIDPCHVYTAPSLAWQACLKMCETPLELLTDINMLLMIENGIRGGISMICHRHARANIPNMSDFRENEAPSYIMYWDANNLYGWAMSQFLPYGGFEWCATSHITEEWILSLSDDSEIGYIFEVDLNYPQKLHPLHNEYPLAPERVTVNEDMISPFVKSLLNNRKFKGTPKLIPNLQDKQNYIVHYRNLKFYLQHGLKMTAVHKAIQFKQAPWLQKYINFNTEKRKEATSTFEKDFFKLLNNSVFGKTMENLRKRRNIVLCNTEKRAKKLVASPAFRSFKTYDEDLTAVERLKNSLTMNRPVYVGFVILELSKLHMYKFHYGFVKETYKDDAKLLFTDTDSLCYHIQTKDVFTDLQQHRDLFDLSAYPKDHPLYSETNKKTIGKFKDELNGELAFEFVGLKSKMYSLKTLKEEKKRAKGVSTRVVQQKIRHEDYLECLQQVKTSMEKQTRIAQDAHHLYTLTQNKISLSPFDDKRYLLEDGITSFAYGHCKISRDYNEQENADLC